MLGGKSGLLARRMASFLASSVTHDVPNKVFYIAVKDSNARAVLDYEVLPGGVLDLYHTEVPPALRGHGIAAKLVQAAFDHCVKNQVKMKLTCTYVLKYYNENKLPEYSELVV